MRRDRGSALLLVIVMSVVFAMLLTITMQHFAWAQRTVRRHDLEDASLHAARGAVRWAQGRVEREPSFAGTLRRDHELGTIVVTVDAEMIRAELRGRKVTCDRGPRARWREE